MSELLNKEAQSFYKLEASLEEICKRFELSDSGKTALDGQDKTLFLNHLIENQDYPDALNFLAHGLPQRETIWWGYLCAEQMASQSSSKQMEMEVLTLVKTWVYRPEDSARRKLELFPEKLQFKTPASWVALAVFWSGGSITPIGQPVVEASEYLYAKAVVGAIMLAAVVIPEKMAEHYQQFLKMGMDIAKGGSGIV